MADYLYSLAASWALWAAVAALLVSLPGYMPFANKLPIIGPYASAARLVAFVSFGVVCGLAATRYADARSEIAQLKRDLSFAEMQISNNAATAAEKAQLADASRTAALVADMKVNSYVQWLALQPAREAGCNLTDADVRWLQDIKPRRARSAAGAVNQPFSRLRGLVARP